MPNTSRNLMVRLHDSSSVKDLASSLFAYASGLLPQEVLFLVLRPLEFELPSFCSRVEFQPICNDYIAGNYVDDIWLKRSPVRPNVPIVRHSLYTPKAMFQESGFYRDVMKNIGCEYGTSLVAWNKDQWLGNLTIFRSESQGDFQDVELPVLQDLHAHFESVVRRMARQHEEKLGQTSLETFIWSLPTAALVLDWNLKLLHYNAAVQELMSAWRNGSKSSRVKRARGMTVSGDILEAIHKGKDVITEMKPNRPGSPAIIPYLKIAHPSDVRLNAKVSFLPSKVLAISRGTFLVVLHRDHIVPDEKLGYNLFSNLSPRERDVVMQAASGLNSTHIAHESGTSPTTIRKQLQKAYEKLGIHSRFELMALFSRHPLLSAAPKNHPREFPSINLRRLSTKMFPRLKP